MAEINFDFSKYDIGGANATKGNGVLEGAEVESAKKDGWNVFDGFKEGTTPTRSNDIFSQADYVQAQPPVKGPTTGGVYAVYDPSSGGSTVYHQDGRVDAYDKDGNIVTPKQTKDVTPKTENKPVNKTEINSNGVRGSYSIVETKNGGYQLLFNMTVTRDNPLKNQLDSTPYEKFYNSENKKYTYKKFGFTGQSFRENIAYQKLQEKTNQFVTQHVIYSDLIQKQKSGQVLTSAEQKFVDAHLNQIKKLGIQFDENGNIINN